MNRKYRFAAFTALTLILLATLAATPAGSVLADEILQFFTRTLGNTLPLPPDQIFEPVPTSTPEPTHALALQPADQFIQTTPTPTPAPTLALGPEKLKDMSLSEAEAVIGFDLYEPLHLPLDYRLTRIFYDPDRQVVTFQYASPQAGSGEFFQVTQGKSLEPLSVGLDAKVEAVALGEHTAEFVRGGWFVANGASESTWENESGVYTLRWQAEDVTISIEFFMNDSFFPAYLGRDEMLAVARDLARCASAEDYACNVSQAAAAAGFTPWQFPAAPAGLSFSGVDYRPGLTALLYNRGMRQFTIQQSGRDFDAPDGNPWPSASASVPADAIQSLTVSGQPAEYVRGHFVARPGESEAVWKADAPVERLRWKNEGWWFQVTRLGPALEAQQLAELAGQLTGDSAQVQAARQQNPLPEDSLPGDVYTDVATLEAALGLDVLEPGVLPEGLSFSHARSTSLSGVMLFYGSFAPDKMHVDGPVLIISQVPQAQASGSLRDIFPPEALQPVEVNGYPGTLITGLVEYTQVEPGQPTPVPVWNPDLGVLGLTWTADDGMTYGIQFDPTRGGARVSLQDLLEIARSLH